MNRFKGEKITRFLPNSYQILSFDLYIHYMKVQGVEEELSWSALAEGKAADLLMQQSRSVGGPQNFLRHLRHLQLGEWMRQQTAAGHQEAEATRLRRRARANQRDSRIF